MRRRVALIFAVLPLLAMADIITSPSPGAALHRIGMEVLVETAVGVAAGSAALRLLFKRRWKWRRDMNFIDKFRFKRRIDAAWPAFEKAWQEQRAKAGAEEGHHDKGDVPSSGLPGAVQKIIEAHNSDVLRSAMANLLAENPEVEKALCGVPIELVCEKVLEQLAPELRREWRGPFVPGRWFSEEDRRDGLERDRRDRERMRMRVMHSRPPGRDLLFGYSLVCGLVLIVMTILPWFIWLIFSTDKSSSDLGTVLGWIAVIGGGIGVVPWLVLLVLMAVVIMRR